VILTKIKRRTKRLLGLHPRASDQIQGFFNGEDIRSLASKPVLSDFDNLSFHNPSKEIQERFVGTSFDNTFTQAARFLNHLFENQYTRGIPDKFGELRILDFGCGWGRMLRLMRSKKELDSTRLYGCDPLRVALEICRRSLPDVYISPCRLYPPSDYRDGMFDIIYAYSVFSHLSEGCHLAWASEFARILQPGGTVCLTTQPRNLIEVCSDYRSGKRKIETAWHQGLSESFCEPDAFAKYDAGEMLYSATGGGDTLEKEAYGEAIVPKRFFEKHWSAFGFELLNWWEPPEHLDQIRVFLRKSAKS